MEYRNVGRSGLQVSVAGLGCNNFGMRIDKDQTAAVVHPALELGVTLFDTADIYGGTRSEEFLGAALGDRRKNVVVATKFVGPVGEGPLNRGASCRRAVSTGSVSCPIFRWPAAFSAASTAPARSRLKARGWPPGARAAKRCCQSGTSPFWAASSSSRRLAGRLS